MKIENNRKRPWLDHFYDSTLISDDTLTKMDFSSSEGNTSFVCFATNIATTAKSCFTSLLA